jgi:Helix-turn-helix domain
MTDDSADLFLTIEDAAKLLRVKRRTLDNLRWKNIGPPYRRHGGRIVYSRKELLEWSEQRRARTSPPDKRRSRPTVHNGADGDRPPRAHFPKAGNPTVPMERERQRSHRVVQPELEPAE